MKRDPVQLEAAAPTWAGRWQQLLQRLHLVQDAAGQQALIDSLRAPAGVRVLAFANAHALNLAARSTEFAADLAAVDVLLRDGAGLALLLRWVGRSPGHNLNGTDFIPRLLAACDGQTLVVLGTREPHLSRGLDALRAHFMPRSRLRAMDGYQRTERYLDFVRRHRPSVVLLAMGMPRQERVAAQLRQALDFPCLIICGGAIVDFLGGKTRRAPPAWRRLGLEWLWRWGQEPRRLFVRYLIGNPVFVLRALWLRARGVSGSGAR